MKYAAYIIKNIKGISLIEILIALGVSIIIGGLVLAILVNSSGVQYSQSTKISQGLSVNDTLQKIRNSLKEAQSVVVGYPEGNPLYTTGTNVLVIKIPSIDGSGNIIDNVFDYVIYQVEENKLKEKVFANVASSRKNTDQLFANNTQNITFTYHSNNGQVVSPTSAEKIVITIIVSQKAGSDTQTLVATSEARLRNN